MLKNRMENELINNILSFWMNHTIDNESGGFYGKINNDLTVIKNAPKGGVLNARILWAFSSAYRIFRKQEYRDIADRAYKYLLEKFVDKEYGGIYWLVDYSGVPYDDRKQGYGQAFAIYAFSEYYRATGEEEALSKAKELFCLMEKYLYDIEFKGYYEACDRQWKLADYRLDKKCGYEKKSMNSMLHIMEAYTNLYRVWKDETLRAKLQEVIQVTVSCVLNNETGSFKLFFDEQWNSIKDECSYGHDIEGSWLLCEAAQVLGDEKIISEIQNIALKMVSAVVSHGIDEDGAVMYERDAAGVVNTDRHMWPQAEAVVGFVNAFQMTGNKEYLQYAEKTWDFIEQKVIDHQFGEWFWGVKRDGTIMNPDSKVDMWKCPYHNSRACMEIIERMG